MYNKEHWENLCHTHAHLYRGRRVVWVRVPCTVAATGTASA